MPFMPSPQIQIRLSEEDLKWVDQYAETTALTRSGILKLALSAFRKNQDAAGPSAPTSSNRPPKRPPARPTATRSPSGGSYQLSEAECGHKIRRPDGTCAGCGHTR